MPFKTAFRTCFVILFVAAAYFSLTPVYYPVMHLFRDKINHFVGYFLLYATLDLGFATSEKLFRKFLLVLGYSVLLEILQHFTPTRQFSLFDILANFLGITLYLVMLPAVAKTKFYSQLTRT